MTETEKVQDAVIEDNNTQEAEAAEDTGAKLSEDDSKTLMAAHQAVTNGQVQLGATREQYLQEEKRLVDVVSKAQQSFEGVMRTLATKHGIDFSGGEHVLRLDTMSFEKRKQ